MNGAVRPRLGTGKVSFASREDATALTSMAFVGITAFGLPGVGACWSPPSCWSAMRS